MGEIRDETLQLVEELGLRLTRKQREVFDSLFDHLGKEEIDFFKEILTKDQKKPKTPAVVRNMMVKRYLGRYTPHFTENFIKRIFGVCHTWNHVHAGISRWVREMNAQYDGFSNMILRSEGSEGKAREYQERKLNETNFWDKMRDLLFAIPPRNEYNSDSETREATVRTRPKVGWIYPTCRLCWRVVPNNPAAKKRALCFLHNIPASSSIYRRHSKISERVDGLRIRLSRILNNDFQRLPNYESQQKEMFRLLTSQDSPLPMLVKYLEKNGHQKTPEDLFLAFHGPFPNESAPAYYAAAIKEYYNLLAGNQYHPEHQRCSGGKQVPESELLPPLFSPNELCRAEAWLTILAEDKRMGPRSKCTH